MFNTTALASTPTVKLILGFSLCTLGCTMLYAYYKSRNEEDESQDSQQSNGQQKGQQKKISVKLAISNEHIPVIIGRNGANLTAIEDKTKTTITFRDKGESHKVCDIVGFPEGVALARKLVLKAIESSPIVKEEILVPASVCGKIVGRCGEAMQEICRISLAKVTLDSGLRHGNPDRRRIIITGNRSQVNIARKLLEDKIQEDEEVRRLVEAVEQTREPRRSPTNSMSSSIYSSQTSLSSAHLPPRDKLMASLKLDEKTMEVYVSASASPSKFWVQLVGPQSKRLDDLVHEMSEYYEAAEHREMHKIAEPFLGQIVATIFKNDGKWYRAEIVGILPNQYNASEVVLDLYFVDYGDSEYVRPHEVYELRTDFLTLRFQAVECFLANIKSTLPNDSELWETQAIQKFEDLSQVGNWKKLISRVVTYKERRLPKYLEGMPTGQSAYSREGSPIPGIELYDPVDGMEVNIGQFLVSQGLALTSEDQCPQSPYQATMDRALSVSGESLPDAIAFTKISPEDALLEQQLEHLQRNNNLYLKNGNGFVGSYINPAKQITADYLNGNFNGKGAAAPVNEQLTRNRTNLNGN